MMSRLLNWFCSLFKSQAHTINSARSLSLLRAQELIAAIDRGGIPLSPIIVNRIGRNLGLEILPSDPMSLTIQKIRNALD